MAYTGLVAGDNYYDLEFEQSGSGGSTWILDAPLDVNGYLSIVNASSIVDLEGYNATITGAFNNSGTLRLYGGETISSIPVNTPDLDG